MKQEVISYQDSGHLLCITAESNPRNEYSLYYSLLRIRYREGDDEREVVIPFHQAYHLRDALVHLIGSRALEVSGYLGSNQS